MPIKTKDLGFREPLADPVSLHVASTGPYSAYRFLELAGINQFGSLLTQESARYFLKAG